MTGTGWIANRTLRWVSVLFLAIGGGALIVVALTPNPSSLLSISLGVIAIVALVLAVRCFRAGVKLGSIGFVSR